jgi:5-formyltetrahydrofolate cyclo-ligase
MQNTITSEKSRLREILRKKRFALSAEEVEKKSQEINQNFITNLLPKILTKNSKKIFSLYLSSNNEVATNSIAEHFLANQINFSYPKIIKKNQPLEFILFKKNQKFLVNNFYPTICEPDSGEKILPDFLILPLLAFDHNLSRLGMGGGFFDRTINSLKKQKSSIITIGLGYEFQRLEEILPIEITDQRLDFIVTEKIIFSAS